MRAAFLIFSIASALTSNILADSCDQLKQLKLSNATVFTAELVPAGTFVPPGVALNSPDSNRYKSLPAFCRAVLEATPSADSQIPIEVWMPAQNWNHKYRGQGNGGFAGATDYHGMAGSLSLGYATSATDTGHKADGTDASWALNHPEKIADFGYRAIHVTAELSKTVIQAFYGEAPQRAYFDSCSDGGREALMEAQRFPGDYDGILAGAPANDWTHLLSNALAVQKAINSSPQKFIAPEKLPAITNAALKACDSPDGVRDGILNDPTRCHFDTSALLCDATESTSCLSAPQLSTLKTIYAGAFDAQGRQIFPPAVPSSEDGDGGWKDWITGTAFEKDAMKAFATNFFKYMVYNDPNWDYHNANIEQALQMADSKTAAVLNSTNPDLAALKARRGKLILYHGWLDPAISAMNTINYYKSVANKMGSQSTDDFVRLYMVPGMRHCFGGPGPDMFGQLGISVSRDPEQNIFTSLEQWVEAGAAPKSIIATKLKDDKDPSKGVLMTRPLCPYPETAVYDGKGDPNNSRSFSCGRQ